MYELLSLAKHRETSLQLQFTNMAQFNLIATQLEDAIREAEEEAETRLKMTLPDDPDYFDLFRAYDEANNVEHELTLDQHLDPYAPGISIEDRVYPKNTNAGVKVDQGERDFIQVKRWVKGQHPQPAKRWSKCHDFFEKRHTIFVREKLKGMALQTYESMSNVARDRYRSLHGFQKTNFVISMIAERCFIGATQQRHLALQRFYSYSQRSNQTATEYVNFLEGHRSNLRKSVVFVSDEDLKVKLMTTLNLQYTEATHLYDYDKATLEEVKRKLVEVDVFMQRKRSNRRAQRDSESTRLRDESPRERRSKNRDHSHGNSRPSREDRKSRRDRQDRRSRRARSRSRERRSSARTPFVSDDVFKYVANKIRRRDERKKQEQEQNGKSPQNQEAPKNQNTNAPPNRKCYLCGKRGHIPENCFSKNKDKRPKPTAPVASVDDSGSISDSTTYTSSSYSHSSDESDGSHS